MEERKVTTSSEDYKFLTKNDLEQLNASHLVGSKILEPYMHGYFMDIKQYQKLKAVTDPFAFEKYRKKKIDEKLDELRDNRIVFQRALPKVNTQFARDLLKADKKRMRNERKVVTKKTEEEQEAPAVLTDSRFSKMFKDKDYMIDKDSEAYKLNNPVEKARYNRDESDEEQDMTALQNILGDTVKPKQKHKQLEVY